MSVLFRKNIKKRIYLSVCIGLTAALLSCGVWKTEINGETISEQQMLAWWGTLFPWFCFQEKPESQNTESGNPEIVFWLAELWN